MDNPKNLENDFELNDGALQGAFDTADRVTADGEGEPDENGETHSLEKENGSFSERLRRLPDTIAALWRDLRKKTSLRAKESATGAALGLAAYLLGTAALPFGVYPLGLGLLCASVSRVAWIFLGLCISALTLGDRTFIYIFAYATAVTVRLLTKLLTEDGDTDTTLRPFGENIYLRMSTSAVAAFMVGLYSVIVGELQPFYLWGTLLSVLAAPLSTLLYSGAFEGDNKRFRDLSMTAIFVSVTYALRDMYFVGISGGVFFAFFITLFVCRRRGVWQGAVIGLLTGLAYSPVYAPVFVMSGIAAGALWSISAFGALTAAGAAGILWGFYVEGLSSMSKLLPAMMLSAACYLWAQKLSFFPAARDLLFSGRYCRDMNGALIDRESRQRSEDRMEGLAEAFSSLSDIFYNLSDRLSRPGIPELTRMCDGVYDRYCPECKNREVCWGIEYADSRELLANLSSRLATGGVADVSDLPEYMRRRCIALPGMIGEINEKTAIMYRTARNVEKTQVFAMDYAAVSEILRDAEEESRNENAIDEELCERLTGLLAEYGFGEGGVTVYGQRMKRIVARGFDISGAGIGMKELKSRMEEVCGFPISDPVLEIKEGFLTLRASAARSFRTRSVTAVDSTGAEECGDTALTFENGEDRYYALISDGMGKGREAAFTSGVCSVFIRKMLSAGNRVPTVIRMLNSFVRAKPDECSAAIDLMELDLLNGRVEFYKCGAAATYVRRGDNVFKLTAETMPLGILKATDTAKLSFEAEDGDLIIMMSDGVTRGEEDALWLLSILSTHRGDDIEGMKKTIIEEARRQGSSDDISVAMVKVEKINNE